MDSVTIFPTRDIRDARTAHDAPRAPTRFRDRVVAQFRSPANLAYLRDLFAGRVPAGPPRAFVLATLPDAAHEFSSASGRALEVLASDPEARRGALRPAVDLWGEVRRLNRAFYEDRLAVVREQAHNIDRRPGPRDSLADDDEPYHVRMFTADSLRPPGLERLNGVSPLHDATVQRRDKDHDEFLYGEDDAPWSAGNAGRTPEQAIAEYWGEGATASGGGAAPGTKPEKRFMRYESSPFWQRGGREGYDFDIEDTLGVSGRELDGQVRRWDMARPRNPRAQEYRRYGARTHA
jgi:hypothetical protein